MALATMTRFHVRTHRGPKLCDLRWVPAPTVAPQSSSARESRRAAGIGVCQALPSNSPLPRNLINTKTTAPNRYSAAMRWLHWLRAGAVLGTLAIGVIMVNLPDESQAKFDVLYPNHKQFGLLASMR